MKFLASKFFFFTFSKAICLFSFSFHCRINRKASAFNLQLHKDSKVGVRKIFLQTWNRKFQAWNENSLTGESNFLTGKSHFLTGKSNFLTGKSNFLTGKSHFLTGKSNFLTGKSHSLTGERNFLTGKSHSLTGKSHSLTGKMEMQTGNFKKHISIHGKEGNVSDKPPPSDPGQVIYMYKRTSYFLLLITEFF